MSKKYTVVDLFSGSGAVSEALKRVGFRILAAVDSDPVACATYRLNHPEVHLDDRDIRRIDPAELGIPESIDLLVICAPCQPFSQQNKKRENDPRAQLVLEGLKFVDHFRPKIVFVENVPGLTISPVFRRFRRGLRKRGYYVSRARIFDAADFNVAQRRVRCVLVACLSQNTVKWFNRFRPTPVRITVRSVIGKLKILRAGEADPDDPLHKARQHQAKTLRRLEHIPADGGSRSSLPPELELDCHKNAKRANTFPDVYGRMPWDDVAPTLTTGCTDVTRGRFAHPEQHRAITHREAALLQGFPTSYQFAGNLGDIATQIGNAVPLGMVEALGREFVALLDAVV